MSVPNFRRATMLVVVLVTLLSLFTTAVSAKPQQVPASPVTFTILHTNDFHGQLDSSLSSSNPGSARIQTILNQVRTQVGAGNVLVADVGDEMQGSLLSNLGDGTPTGKGKPVIAAYNAMGYSVATFGNHEFDWGQVNLKNRTDEALYPYVTANIVKNDTGNCSTAGWQKPDFADAPYQILTVGSPVAVKVAFIGVTTTETPTITVSTATAGICFKDPAESILHYYDEMKSQTDVIVVLSHLGYADGGYGYGIPVYGDQTLAAKLNTAGKPVNLILGGHSHSNLSAATVVGNTTISQSYYNGRTVGRADITVSTTGAVSIAWSRFNPINTVAKDPTIDALVTSYATDPTYLAIVNQPVGYSAVDLGRSNTTDNMMGTFIDDAIYNYLNTDGDPANDIDLFFNNAGGIRTDWCYVGGAWTSAGCTAGVHAPALLNYGHMFTILPFGNATAVGKMTGAKILEVINYAPNVAGMIQPAGLKYKYYAYKDFTNPPATPTSPYLYAWGAYDVQVLNKSTGLYEPLDLNKTYSVGTNEFLAPAGGDGYNAFKYMTNITYWGDMLNAVNAYVAAHYTVDTPYMGPKNDGTLDGRIAMDGDSDFVYDPGEIVPLTILHHNDSHGNLTKGAYVGYTQLATVINQEKLHNQGRTLLLSGGDNIQGDSMMYYFKSAGLGSAADGTPLPADLQINPLIKAFNSMGYDAVDLGNHEFNFGSEIFKTLKQASFPLLGANVSDTGAYGLAEVGVKPYVEKTLGPEGIKVAILGITNHRVPNYELPSNIPGLTFSDPIAKAQELSNQLNPTNDVVIALTHIGFTEDPKSVEVDKNVDTNLAKTVTGIDAIIGSHSHTNPATGFGDYKYLPSIVADPTGKPVIIGQAYRYNNTLGEVVLGLRAKVGGGYEVVSETGRYLTVATSTVEDAAVKAIVDPYVSVLAAYNNKVIGQTTTPLDTRNAYIGETNAANMQADAAMFELQSHSITPDFHLSGAMTRPSSPNDLMFPAATAATPATLTVSNMFTLMPYENSLVVLNMNGPQLKAVLERAYRNYYYYKYVPGYGGYSYYTTCMIDTNLGNVITYNEDTTTYDPNKEYVVRLVVNGKEVDFKDANTYYKVSTVNYLAAGSCNFNNNGVSLWPLNQIANDTQYYVRDAVIDYVTAKGTVSPTVDGRLYFNDVLAPTITINAPHAGSYLNTDPLTLDFTATDGNSGVRSVVATLDGRTVANGDVINLNLFAAGTKHVFSVTATDNAYNSSTQAVSFSIETSIASMKIVVTNLYNSKLIKTADVYKGLMDKLNAAAKAKDKVTRNNNLTAFINLVNAQSGKAITTDAANLLIADAQWLIAH
jgi:2',3'-cyclic-nucleotide 2'-phosphodiesterase (5'-nucleotidase family)